MAGNAIEIEGLTKTYAPQKGETEAKTALHNVDLDIPQGSIFGLLGPNGAGKSTLINILAGLVTKTSGTVRIWGFDQDVNPRQSRAAIGVMPQELNLDPFFTPRGSARRAGRALRRAEIAAAHGRDSRADRAERQGRNAYARALSGGMRRRLLLGKALVHDPQILVLDEPTAGVDIELRQMLWKNVRKLNEAGKTIILTTHYLEEAEAMCDEIAIIHHGEVLVRDTTRQLLEPDRHQDAGDRARGPGCRRRSRCLPRWRWTAGATGARLQLRQDQGEARRHPGLPARCRRGDRRRLYRGAASRGRVPRPHPLASRRGGLSRAEGRAPGRGAAPWNRPAAAGFGPGKGDARC